ncbi:hypothetical protein BH10ACI1_BH10ACI1_03010 [soil metagenome]
MNIAGDTNYNYKYIVIPWEYDKWYVNTQN